ncbi:MAG: glycerol-3-phosphate dehydrogenase [Thermoleophilaceae bacterium]|nr:glycerol-3-phosphate dehydrogenase [Thermoleophilaceae bacterium]
MIRREDALKAFAEDEYDLVVIGGGITGAGVALDAATRGYSVALVEREDFASGTSSRSSKLVHGGLRYLQNFDLGLVREALLERSILVNLAPHLVRPLPLLVSSFEGKRPDRMLGVGLNMYDRMARELKRPGKRGREPFIGEEDWSPEKHRIIEGDEVKEMLPALAAREPTAAYLFYDCQTDDARLVLTVLGEAERFGAVCANRCRVDELMTDTGRACGVRCTDVVSGDELEIRAANVVNATGVWADQIRPDELHDELDLPSIRPSRGTHITFAAEDLPLHVGAIVPAGGGRSIFALPWLGRTLIGTTDNDYEGELDHVPPADSDIEYLLDAVNKYFETSLGRDQITGAYAGVRPLISTGDPKKSVDISRKAELYETSSGLVTITGGKLTTWRRMAKLAVDRIVERDGQEAPCRTHEIPLGQTATEEDLEAPETIGEATLALLAHRYGHAARDVLAIAAEDERLAQPISPDLPDLMAEVVIAVRKEQALTVTDVLMRRTRLALLDARRLCAPDAIEPRRVAEAMGRELGWDAARVEAEVAAWHDEAAAEGFAPSLSPAPA